MKNKISVRQISFMYILFASVNKFLLFPSSLAYYCGEDLWLSVLLSFGVDFIFIFLTMKLSERYGNDNFYSICEKCFNKSVTKIIFFSYGIFFIIKTLIPILEQKNSLELTLYDTQPGIFVFLPIFLVAFYISIKGLNPLARATELSIWLGGLAYAVIILLSAPAGEYTALLPGFASGLKIFKGSLKTFLWFGDSIYLLMFLGYFKKENKWKSKIIWGYLIAVALTVIIVIIFYAIFDSIASKQFYAIIRMSKYAISLSNIGRFDYIASFMLCAVSVFQISLNLLLSAECFRKTFNIEKRFIMPLIVCLITAVIIYLTQYKLSVLMNLMQNYVVYFLIVMTYAVPVAAFVTPIRRRNEISQV